MSNSEKYLSFVDHLEEFRQRLIISCIALVIATVVGYFFTDPILQFLLRPLTKAQIKQNSERITFIVGKDGILRLKNPLPQNPNKSDYSRFQFEVIEQDSPERKFVFGHEYINQFYYFSPLTPMILKLKAALILGILFALPVIIYELWRFIIPALTLRERKAAKYILGGAFILFPIGVTFAYYILSFTISFLLSFSFRGLEPRLDVMKYLNFALMIMLAMGCIFEFPLAAMFLGKVGLIKSFQMKKYRKYAIVLIFIASAIITPGPDPFSMIIVAIPLTILYEISIYLVRLVESPPQ